MIVAFENRQQKYPADFLREVAGRTANAVWEDCALAPLLVKQEYDAGVTIHFVGGTRIRTVNKETRGIAKTTDVLSFPMLEMQEGSLPAGIRTEDLDRSVPGRPVLWLGDILICPARAERQAKTYNHSMTREVAFLTAHGMLHLLGFDHMDPGDEIRMNSIQEKVLNALGYRRDSTEGEPS